MVVWGEARGGQPTQLLGAREQADGCRPEGEGAPLSVRVRKESWPHGREGYPANASRSTGMALEGLQEVRGRKDSPEGQPKFQTTSKYEQIVFIENNLLVPSNRCDRGV
jgi:hypothetical protein